MKYKFHAGLDYQFPLPEAGIRISKICRCYKETLIMTTYTTFPATLFQRLVTFNTGADFKSRSVNIFFTFKPTTFLEQCHRSRCQNPLIISLLELHFYCSYFSLLQHLRFPQALSIPCQKLLLTTQKQTVGSTGLISFLFLTPLSLSLAVLLSRPKK